MGTKKGGRGGGGELRRDREGAPEGRGGNKKGDTYNKGKIDCFGVATGSFHTKAFILSRRF